MPYLFNRKTSWCFSLFLLFTATALAQTGRISGTVTTDNQPVAFATVTIDDLKKGTTTDTSGNFSFEHIPLNTYTITARYVGFQEAENTITLTATAPDARVEMVLENKNLQLDQVVVTGTKTFKRQTDAPVIVHVLSGKSMEDVQACTISEGLKFQPGLRVETDCQTCNYTQLRMNGLTGGYSQILINGRPIFSPLTGLYGLEQIPTNMIDRIEVVRGGGSSLYGSSAIGGTVNVLTKIPKKNGFSVDYNFQNINGQTPDHLLNANATVLSKNKKAGISFFANHRNRDFYDHNNDNYSEIPTIKNNSIGANTFIKPSDNQKIEVNTGYVYEYRFGGAMTDAPPHLAGQAEERTHHVWMGSADYQVNFNEDKTSLIAYLAGQYTKRSHYTGILPDDQQELQKHLANPPYGHSDVTTYNLGFQLNHRLDFLNGSNIFTVGSEYLYDKVWDEIPAYNYLIDQQTKNAGTFLQSDWEVTNGLTLLSGLRMDVHNFLDQPVWSPRFSLLYKPLPNTQIRVSYGTGFRAPQAFDADLHIAFAGGGISRVTLSPDLAAEKSQSWSASINYDKPTEKYVAGFTLEGFYTRLNHAFFLQPGGEDDFGEIFEKQNGQGATVQGLTLELRANYDKKIQLETGLTVQTSRYDEAITYIEGVTGTRDFIRTPEQYGFATLTFTPNKKLTANINYVFTGSMTVPHFAGAPNQTEDELYRSPAFSELSTKVSYELPIQWSDVKFSIFGGVKNMLNAYQSQFDIGKNRDSNFVFGPAQPRTFFIGGRMAL